MLSLPRARPVIAFAFVVAMLGTTLPTPLYPLYAAELGFEELMITAIFATYAVGVIAALLTLGHLSDEVGRRGVLMAGLVLAALSAVVFVLADGVTALFLGRLLSGFSAGIFTGTATAYLADLFGERRARGALVATACNIGGLGLGPLVAGAIAQWSEDPLTLPFWTDLVLVAVAAVGLALSPETVASTRRVRLRVQRLALPEDVRGAFVTAATGGFVGFAMLGLFTAVAPGFVGGVLDIDSHLAAGAIVASAFAASAVAQVALHRVPADTALRSGLAVLMAGIGLVALALLVRSLVPLVAGAVVAGAGQGLTFRGGMATVTARLAPTQRGAVISTLFVVLYTAISLPVVGVGLLSQATDLRTAGVIFCVIAEGIALVAALRLAATARREAPAVV